MTAATPPAARAAAGSALLVCVYYRVARADAADAIARVRDFQRTLDARFDGLQSQVLVRCESRADLPPAAARAPGIASADADDTLMETYRLPLPADTGSLVPGAELDAPAALRFMASLDAACAPLAALLRGPRHVEAFVPCAS